MRLTIGRTTVVLALKRRRRPAAPVALGAQPKTASSGSTHTVHYVAAPTPPLFPPLPRSTMSVRSGGRVLHYVEPSRMVSVAWDAGAEFVSPTSLDFEVKTLEGRLLRADAAMPREPMPPQYIVETLRRLWRQVERDLERAGRVVDRDERCGVEVGADWARDFVTFRVRLKTWPAVRGITVAGAWEQ